MHLYSRIGAINMVLLSKDEFYKKNLKSMTDKASFNQWMNLKMDKEIKEAEKLILDGTTIKGKTFTQLMKENKMTA